MYINAAGMTITKTVETYHLTASGKSWKKNPDNVNTETVNEQHYRNYVDSVSFFNGFGGGTCRAERGYTYAGYIPVRITTISPDRQTKLVARFKFDLIR